MDRLQVNHDALMRTIDSLEVQGIALDHSMLLLRETINEMRHTIEGGKETSPNTHTIGALFRYDC